MASKLNLNTITGMRSIDELETAKPTKVAKEVKPINKEAHPPFDPWEIMVEYEVPRPPRGESAMMSVHLNKPGGGDYQAYFPRGKKQSFPLPVYQVVKRAVKAEEDHAVLAEKMSGDFLLSQK